MAKYTCPSCGADIVIRSSLSVSAVCEYCQSLVVRHDLDLELIGKAAQLPDDLTPFQLGTEGVYDGVPFTLIGRMRLGWGDGFWNEWFFAGQDGRKGWLAEAQGTYALSYEVDEPLHPGTRKVITQAVTDAPAPDGRFVTFQGHEFQLTDRKLTVCHGSEGELPLTAARGRKSVCLDFMGGPDAFASIDAFRDEYRLFMGRYVEWDDLKISRGREIEGWS